MSITRLAVLALCTFSLLNFPITQRVFAAEQDCTGFEQRAANRSEAGNWWLFTAAGVLAALGIDYIDDGKKDAPSRGLAIGASSVAAGFAGMGLYSKASAYRLRRVCTARAEAVSELVLAPRASESSAFSNQQIQKAIDSTSVQEQHRSRLAQ